MKDFIIIGNSNAVISKDIFPHIRDGKVRLGYNLVKTFDTDKGERKFGNITWYSTFPVDKKPLALTASYTPEAYPTYDNYPAIDVGKIKDIPYDYYGTMGVPVTIFNYDLKDMEIIQVGGDNLPKPLFEQYLEQGNKAHYGKPLLIYKKDGMLHMPFNRVMIRRKDYDNQ